jgi:hypothetical protein
MAYKESAELTEPCVGALDDPASLVASEFPAVCVLPLLAVLAIRNDEVDASFLQPFSQRIGVVGTVGDHPFRFLSRTAFRSGDFDFGERGFRKRNFCRRGTLQPNSQRKTATVDQYHPLRALATLGFADGGAPFFAGAKLPSRNVSSTSAGLRHRARPTALAMHRAKHPALPTASAAASRSRAKDTCRAKNATPRSATPTGCLQGRPDSTPTDGPGGPCAASAQATAARSTPTAHPSTTQTASCSCKKFIKQTASHRSPQIQTKSIYETRSKGIETYEILW